MKKYLILGCLFSVLMVSCTNNFMSISTSAPKPKKKVMAKSAVDTGKYMDMTLENKSAALYTKSDFAAVVTGRYYNGESFVDVDMAKGKVHFYTPDCCLPDYKGKSFDSTFIYDVKAASKDCLYISPSTKNGVDINIDGNTLKAIEAPSFCLFLPLYGFGQSRIEVNPILNGEIALPSGTYWKK